jgi:ankyrin repeat protein
MPRGWVPYKRRDESINAVRLFHNVDSVEFFAAVCSGNEADARAYLAKGVSSNTTSYGPLYNPALNIAARGDDTAIVQLLLESKADVNMCNALGVTPLHEAAMAKTPDALRILLLTKGANSNVLDAMGSSPLSWVLRRSFELKSLTPTDRVKITLLLANSNIYASKQDSCVNKLLQDDDLCDEDRRWLRNTLVKHM